MHFSLLNEYAYVDVGKFRRELFQHFLLLFHFLRFYYLRRIFRIQFGLGYEGDDINEK